MPEPSGCNPRVCHDEISLYSHPHANKVVVKTFESDAGTERVREPYAIAYDYPNQLIYWTDAAYGMLIYADVFGHDGAIEARACLLCATRLIWMAACARVAGARASLVGDVDLGGHVDARGVEVAA